MLVLCESTIHCDFFSFQTKLDNCKNVNMALFLLTVNFIFPINQNFLHKYEICSALFVLIFSFSYQAIFLRRFLHQHKICFLPQAAAAPSVLLDSMSPGLKVRAIQLLEYQTDKLRCRFDKPSSPLL